MLGKSLEGSGACFLATFTAAFAVSHNLRAAVLAAVTVTVVEALPLEDYDNIAIPMMVGCVLMIAR
jgi:dolichol kinase